MLDKRHVLGGLQVGGPRTAQNPARFRAANNVYQTRDDVMVPRFHNQLEDEILTTDSDVVSVSTYNEEPFVIAKSPIGGKFHFIYGDYTSKVPMLDIQAADFSAYGEADTFGPQTVEKFGCLYIHFPAYGLHKFDGFQAYKAGVPLPYFSSAQRADAGAAYIRVIQHHIDMQGNVVNSGYVEFRATPASNLVTLQIDKNAVDMLAMGYDGVSPTVRTSRLDGYYDESYWIASGAGSVDAGAMEVTITTGGDHSVAIGAYVQVIANLTLASVTGFSGDAMAIALKVKSENATTVVLDMTDARWLDNSGNWNTEALSTGTTLFSIARNGSNYWASTWASNAATGNYVFRGAYQVLYGSTTAQYYSIDCASLVTPLAWYVEWPFNFAGNLGDTYDVTTVKDVFPHVSPMTPNPEYSLSFTTFGDLAVLSSEQSVFFSDSSQGGSFEMMNGLSFAIVGEGNDGKIQAVCANSDFLIVSRKKRNYYLSGNLATGNYRTQGITNTSVGAYSNESCIAVEDKVLLFNSQGIWAIYQGGRCTEVSENIKGLFKNWSETFQFPEEIFFDISGYQTFGSWGNFPNEWVRVRYDSVRGLVIFLIAGDGTGEALILNMNNGEFYTWNGFTANHGITSTKVKDINFIDGEYYIGFSWEDGGNYNAALYKEVKTGGGQYDYVPSAYPIRLDTTWFTAGEPSMEKKLNQLKLFGIITGGVSILHFLDWKASTVGQENDDGNYANQDQYLFSHKKRLKPANFLAVSISMEVSPGSGRFELEGLEIEFQPLQEGMKR